MIGLIVTGHGHFASGMTSSLNLIGGEQECYQAVDFLQEYSVEDLAKKLEDAMNELSECEGILVLSDLPGGSPFKTAVEIGVNKKNIVVVAGTNLPMLVEVAMARKFIDNIEDLTNMALNTGKDQVVRFEMKKVVQEDVEDGI